MFRSLIKMSSKHTIPNILLTEFEAELFGLINAYLRDTNRKTVVRVAGGWVRDKILGRNSNDIDLTLDDSFGEEFAKAFSMYLKSNGHCTKSVAVIKANPDQSKHLQTAKWVFKGQEIDFVNLRAEDYAQCDADRIPEISMGTPLVDSQRRDLTINSLFYNVNTQTVEDFTGMGLSDLSRGIIRTPIDPVKTYLDDPLRIYRTIRFAARFNFRLADELTSAILSNLYPTVEQPRGILDALQRKVSKERLQIEFLQILQPDRRPGKSILTMYRLGVFPSLLCIDNLPYLMGGEQVNAAESRKEILFHSCYNSIAVSVVATNLLDDYNNLVASSNIDDIVTTFLRHVDLSNSSSSSSSSSSFSMQQDTVFTDKGGAAGGSSSSPPLSSSTAPVSTFLSLNTSNISEFYLATVVSGIRKLGIVEKKKTIELHTYLLRNILKYENDIVKWVTEMIKNVDIIRGHSLSHSVCFANTSVRSDGIGLIEREEAGLCIQSLRGYWLETILLACSIEIVEAIGDSSLGIENFSASTIMEWPAFDLRDARVAPIFLRYLKLIHLWGHQWNLVHQCINLKPLLGGENIKALTDICVKNPTLISVYVSLQNRWQLRYNSDNEEDLKRYLLSFSIEDIKSISKK